MSNTYFTPLYIFFLVPLLYIFSQKQYKSEKDAFDASEALIHKGLTYPWQVRAVSGQRPGAAGSRQQAHVAVDVPPRDTVAVVDKPG